MKHTMDSRPRTSRFTSRGSGRVIEFPRIPSMPVSSSMGRLEEGGGERRPDRTSVSVPMSLYPPDLMVVEITTTSQLHELAPEWQSLHQRMGCSNPFMRPEWLLPWWAHWGGGQALSVLGVRNRGGRLVAVAPFYVQGNSWMSGGGRALRFIGDHSVGSDHFTILVEPECEPAAIRAVTHWIRRQASTWDSLELRDVLIDSPALAAFQSELCGSGLSRHAMLQDVCPYAPLPATFEAFLSGVGGNLRYNFRRRRRTLERDHGVDCVVLRDAGDLRAHFPDLVRLHGMRFDQKAQTSLFLEPKVQQFHADTVSRMAEGGMARLLLLRQRGKAVAALYGFAVGKTFSFYQSGMDPALAKLSVGLVMMGCSIEEAIRAGQTEFDFLRGRETYKFQWTTQVRSNTTVSLFDGRFRSRMMWATAVTRDYLRLMKRQLRGYLRCDATRVRLDREPGKGNGGASS